MRYPTVWYVRPAKPQISLRIRTVWSEPLLVIWVFYDCKATDWTPFWVSKLNTRLQRPVRVNTCQNVKLLEISCRGSYIVDRSQYWTHNMVERNSNNIGDFHLRNLIKRETDKYYAVISFLHALIFFHDFVVVCWLFFKINHLKIFQEHYQNVKWFGRSIGPDVVLNCSQRLSADVKIRHLQGKS